MTKLILPTDKMVEAVAAVVHGLMTRVGSGAEHSYAECPAPAKYRDAARTICVAVLEIARDDEFAGLPAVFKD
jgi:hypothetical protein